VRSNWRLVAARFFGPRNGRQPTVKLIAPTNATKITTNPISRTFLSFVIRFFSFEIELRCRGGFMIRGAADGRNLAYHSPRVQADVVTKSSSFLLQQVC
jgi:hypothetical protein